MNGRAIVFVAVLAVACGGKTRALDAAAGANGGLCSAENCGFGKQCPGSSCVPCGELGQTCCEYNSDYGPGGGVCDPSLPLACSGDLCLSAPAAGADSGTPPSGGASGNSSGNGNTGSVTGGSAGVPFGATLVYPGDGCGITVICPTGQSCQSGICAPIADAAPFVEEEGVDSGPAEGGPSPCPCGAPSCGPCIDDAGVGEDQ